MRRLPITIPLIVLAVVLGALTSLGATLQPGGSRDGKALAKRLRQILAAPEYQEGFWGVYVYSLDSQRVVFDQNGERWFTPASNAKLFTLAAALHILGADYRFHTALDATATPDTTGVVKGDLVWMGTGDPSISGRLYPYRVDPPAPAIPYDPELVPERLAAAVAAKGVTHITGNIVGDDSAFTPDPYPRGWAIGDMVWDYGAPVSALTVNDNTRFLQVLPAEAVGGVARLQFAPSLNSPACDDQVVTTPAGTPSQVRLEPDPLTGALRLTGHLAIDSPGVLEALAVREPALFAAQLLRQALIEKGVVVDGEARARHTPAASDGAATFELAGWDSPPLAQVLQATAKVSQNLEAELVLRQLGRLHGMAPTAAAGEIVVRDFLQDIGLGAGDDALDDGSGLSRQDLVTPAGVVRLLAAMERQPPPEAAAWLALFPVAAQDGTLEHRFRDTSVAGRLLAKTGSLSHDYALSGYLTTRRGEHLAFAILSNNVNRPSAAVRNQVDRLASALDP